MESSEIIEQIDGKYLIKEKIGSGGEANVFLVSKKGTDEEYAAKVPKKEENTSEQEISSLEQLKQYNCPYIVNLIEYGEGEIIRKNRKNRIRKYCILENAPYGNLIDYIYENKRGFGELKGKIIFYNIVQGVKLCHENNICHRDLKLDNILLDKNFCQKISDFGHSCINAPDLDAICGTEEYNAPEVGRRPFDGIKADVFSLGSMLMILVAGIRGFGYATKKDELYQKIMHKNYDKYWELVDPKVKSNGIEKLSEEFKDLYIQMIKYFPDERIESKNILNHPWFNEIKIMKKEKKEEYDNLVNEINKELEKLAPNAMKNNQTYLKNENIESLNAPYNKKSGDDDEYKFFEDNCKPKFEDTPINMKNCIKIKGDLDSNQFMNKLCNKLILLFGKDNCQIEANKEKLKVIIKFYKKQEKKEKEKTEEEKDEEEEEEENDEENEKVDEYISYLKIKVKLYQVSDGHLLRFIQDEGNREDFLDKFGEISNFVKKLIS